MSTKSVTSSITTVALCLLAATILGVACEVNAQTPTNIEVTNAIQQASVKRFGVNLGDQSYWDSGQMMKNLVFRNPGFEGLYYRSILKCAHVTANTCQDDNQYSRQGTGFWDGAPYRIMSGASDGMTGTIVTSMQNPDTCSGCGQIITFDKNINAKIGDYFVMTQYFPGTPEQGWWHNVTGGAQLLNDTTDLSPESPGKQALLIQAAGANQTASVTQYFDSFANISFIQLNGAFEVTFRAKGLAGNKQINVSAQRLQAGADAYLNQTITLTDAWKDYKLTFTASETGSAVGTVQLVFGVAGANVLLDDVSLDQTNSDPTNTTAFRDDVVNALKELHPGTIRMMAAGAALGSDIPNQLKVPLARYRAGFNTNGNQQDDIPYGIHEFLELCQATGADPWMTLPTATTEVEMTDLILYLTGDGSDSFSASRIARGQIKPWTSVFGRMTLGLGNETWNGSFKGESMAYPAYPLWANKIFGAARKAPGFVASKFDLMLSGWAAVPDWNGNTLSYSTQHDSIAIAPYLLYSGKNESQALMFGALFAEPEMFELPGGQIYRDIQQAATAARTTELHVYETNLGTMVGDITQLQLDALTPSIGAGIAHSDHMLQMMRAGIQTQNTFALQQYMFLRQDQKTVRLWGSVVDMGTTNRRRPQFLTQMMVNQVIHGNMVVTAHTGANPTWDQPLSSDSVQLKGAHYLQSFAFVDGKVSTIIFNLHLTSALPVTFSGPNAPSGTVDMSQITSTNITDNNEFADVVKPTTKTLTGFNSSTILSLPPFSMTVLTMESDPTSVQAPTFSVAEGMYATAQSVTIATPTTAASIYYTIDGTQPTTASSKYTGAISVSKTLTLQAIAFVTGQPASPVTSAAYVIAPATVATPAFSVPAGSYATSQTVVLTDSTPGAVIYFTTNGINPTATSTVYTVPIAVTKTQTIKAMARAANMVESAVASALYTITPPTVATPKFSVAAGSYATTQTVSLSDTTEGAAIFFTVDGSTPTAVSTRYTAPIIVSSTQTIKAIATAVNYSQSAVASALYTIAATAVAATPTFSIASGTYSSALTVSIADTTPGAVIYFTTDGSTPTTASTKYTAPITVTATETIKAMATAVNFTQSAVATALYTISIGTPPVISFPSGFTAASLTLNNGVSIVASTLQLTDGKPGEARSAWFPTPVNVQTFTTDFNFRATAAKADGFTFAIQNATNGPYSIGGNGAYLGYGGIQKSVAVKFDLYDNAGEGSDSTGVYINGAVPTLPSVDLTNSEVDLHLGHIMKAHISYDGTTLAVTITDTITGGTFTTTKAINIPSIVGLSTAYVGFTGSTGGATATQNVLSWSYTSNASTPVAATPTFTPGAGTYATTQTITISDTTVGATIYFTKDGSTPTTTSAKYTAPFSVSTNETIKAMATALSYTQSAVATAVFAVTASKATPPTFSIAAGTYLSTQTVSLSDTTPGAVIYYSVNGLSSTTPWAVYTTPIIVTSTETISAFAAAPDYDPSTVATASYTITLTAATPTFSVKAGTYATAQTLAITDLTPGAVIYYSVDGPGLTTPWTVYTAPITISTTETIKAIAVAANYDPSAVAIAQYLIQP